jgi:hypothetical protein
VFPVTRVKRFVGRWGCVCRKAQYRIECCHGVKPAVEPIDVFVEVGLKVVLGDGAVISICVDVMAIGH